MNKKNTESIEKRHTSCVVNDGGCYTVEPYCYGVSGIGHEVLRPYQLDGHSDPEAHEGRKLFKTSRIKIW